MNEAAPSLKATGTEDSSIHMYQLVIGYLFQQTHKCVVSEASMADRASRAATIN